MTTAAAATTALAGFPSIVPATVLGAQAPSNQITIGAIGVGRISRVHDLPGVSKHPQARVMAVCDLDAKRVEDAKVLVNGQYATSRGASYDGVTGYGDYRELLANRDVDAVIISTRTTVIGNRIAAARAVKQSTCRSRIGTIAEGRALSDAVHRSGVTSNRQPAAPVCSPPRLRAGPQRPHGRSRPSGRLPVDPAGEAIAICVAGELALRHVARLTPRVPYTRSASTRSRLRPTKLVAFRAVRRRHDPGWARTHRHGPLGHGTEHTVREVWGSADPNSGLWNVHGPFAQSPLRQCVQMFVSGSSRTASASRHRGRIFVSAATRRSPPARPKLKDTQALAAAGDPRFLDSGMPGRRASLRQQQPSR